MKDCCNEHPDHSEETKRLNRASGQLEGIKKMIEERRYCPDIMTQLQAVQSALKSVEANILKRHFESCVKDAFQEGNADEKVEELIKLFKKS